MNIILSQNGSKPIYEQIVEQIKKLILSGNLNADDALPSMRLLAKELRVSLITTKRAYEELERSGYIYTIAGKGCFVRSGNHETIYNEQFTQITKELSDVVSRAKLNNISLDELKNLLVKLYEQEWILWIAFQLKI